MIPKYVNCQNPRIEVCDYYMHKDCKETCAYARDIKGTSGIGAMVKEDVDRIFEKNEGRNKKL